MAISKTATTGPKGKAKVATVMDEFKHGTLHSGGSGEKVTSRKQAVAIALNEARHDTGSKVPAKGSR